MHFLWKYAWKCSDAFHKAKKNLNPNSWKEISCNITALHCSPLSLDWFTEKEGILSYSLPLITKDLCSCGMRWSWWNGWIPSPSRITCTRKATFQVKQTMLPYNTIMFFIGYILFRLDIHLQGSTYILLIKVGHWSQRCWHLQEFYSFLQKKKRSSPLSLYSFLMECHMQCCTERPQQVTAPVPQ